MYRAQFKNKMITHYIFVNKLKYVVKIILSMGKQFKIFDKRIYLNSTTYFQHC